MNFLNNKTNLKQDHIKFSGYHQDLVHDHFHLYLSSLQVLQNIRPHRYLVHLVVKVQEQVENHIKCCHMSNSIS